MRRLVVEALHKAGREDLIGYGKDCLVRPLHGGRPPEKPKASDRHAGTGRARDGRPASKGGTGRAASGSGEPSA